MSDDKSMGEILDLAEKRDRLIRLEQIAAVTTEKVAQAALLHASDKFNQDEADPGWGAEMHEDMLRDAIVEAAAAISTYKTTKHEYGL